MRYRRSTILAGTDSLPPASRARRKQTPEESRDEVAAGSSEKRQAWCAIEQNPATASEQAGPG